MHLWSFLPEYNCLAQRRSRPFPVLIDSPLWLFMQSPAHIVPSPAHLLLHRTSVPKHEFHRATLSHLAYAWNHRACHATSILNIHPRGTGFPDIEVLSSDEIKWRVGRIGEAFACSSLSDLHRFGTKTSRLPVKEENDHSFGPHPSAANTSCLPNSNTDHYLSSPTPSAKTPRMPSEDEDNHPFGLRPPQVLLVYLNAVPLPALRTHQMTRKRKTTSPIHVVLARVRKPTTQRPS